MSLRMYKYAALGIALMATVLTNAQSLVEVNPLEVAAVGAGTIAVNTQTSKAIVATDATALELAAIAGLNAKMRQWEDTYSKYLQDGQNFASALRAGSTIVNDAIDIFFSLVDIGKAIDYNKQGILAAELDMPGLYLDVVIELVSTYHFFKSLYKKEDDMKKMTKEERKKNMLTGADRVELLWTLQDHMSALSKKLRNLDYSLRVATFSDIWFKIKQQAGVVDRKDISKHAVDRWNRAGRAIIDMNK